MREHFRPIPGLWRFHLIYFLVTLIMGWGFFPYALYLSLVLIAVICFFGIVCSALKWFAISHVLALVIGLGTPMVVIGQMNWIVTVLTFLLLFGIVFRFRRDLF